ncbi:uncharacterized protein JCM6883_003741 [Sporobolomyces salmoneus]|uniref:uncharacterized protein n=1 Tax=Sporobolomyces salmoneus TaxID=183962 RepID=UPI0031721E02
MSGSSTNSIRCFQATDCAAAGYGIPSNAHYKCDSQGFCTFECNSNYTLFSEACWLNGTVSKDCNCDPSRPSSSSSTFLPTPPPLPPPSPTTTDLPGSDDTSGDDVEEVEETITVTETSLSIITKSSDSPPPATITSSPEPTSTRHPKYVTVTELSISIVPYIPPIISQTFTKTKTKTRTQTQTQYQTQYQTQIQTQTETNTQTNTKTKYVTITSLSVSTASPSPRSSSEKVSKPKTTSSLTASASSKPKSKSKSKWDSCKKTPDCEQKIPSNSSRICLKQLCKWRCNKGYLRKNGKCVKKPTLSTKPPVPPCGCVLPSSSVPTAVSTSISTAVLTSTKVVTQTVLPSPSSASTSEESSIVPPSSSSPIPLPIPTSTSILTSTSVLFSTSTLVVSPTSKTQARSTRRITATVTSTLVSTTEVIPTSVPAPVSPSSPSVAATITIFTAASPTVPPPSQTVTVTTPVTISIAPVRPLPTPRIIYVETCSCDEDCTINVPADATPICDPKPATCTWQCNPGFWINSDGSGCLPEGSAFAAAFSRKLMVLPPTITRPHTYSLYIPTETQEAAPSSRSSKPDPPSRSNSTRQLNHSFAAASPLLNSSSSTSHDIKFSTFSNSTPFLLQHYSPNSFFDSFFFADQGDESNGFVNYVESEEAAELELTTFTNSAVTLSMDRDSDLSGEEARDSVRISSKELIQPNNLLLIDLAHIPTGCFVFPSIYLHGANGSLPLNNGEIDIFDGSSSGILNRYAVRTPSSCSLTPQAKSQAVSHCPAGVDCSLQGEDTPPPNKTMNRDGDGIIAVQLGDSGINVWQWSRSQIPQDVASGSPRHQGWSDPVASWKASSCDIASTFRDLRLATRCGAWRGQETPSLENFGTCSSSYPTCEAAVRDSTNFAQAFFEINSVKVYSL